MKKIGEGGKKVWDLQTLVESEESTTGTNRDTDLFIIHFLHFFRKTALPCENGSGQHLPDDPSVPDALQQG